MLMVWAAPLACTVLVFLSNTSTRLIGAFHPPQHTATQPLLQTTGNLLEKEKSGRSNCECVCAFVSLRACLLASPRQLGARRRGRQKGQNLAFLSLYIYYSPSLSPLPIVTRSTENILRDFLPFKTKSWTPPSPITPPVGMLRSEQCSS